MTGLQSLNTALAVTAQKRAVGPFLLKKTAAIQLLFLDHLN
jgi:hypothetical protein